MLRKEIFIDALSHLVIGITIAGLSGHAPSITDPIYMACLAGSQAPDFDIITRLGGKFNYIKQHRSASHSLLGISITSAVIALVIHTVTAPPTDCMTLFAWSLLGALSHVVMDCLNTHGAAVWWPVRKQRYSLNLLNVFDPLLLISILAFFAFPLPPTLRSVLSLSYIALYVAMRYELRRLAARRLSEHFSNISITKVVLMPSLAGIAYWDYIVETKESFTIGQLGTLKNKVTIKADLAKTEISSPTVSKTRDTAIGELFNSLTPFVYLKETREHNRVIINIYDLRYINNQFLHWATVIFDSNLSHIYSYMHYYGNKINISGDIA